MTSTVTATFAPASVTDSPLQVFTVFHFGMSVRFFVFRYAYIMEDISEDNVTSEGYNLHGVVYFNGQISESKIRNLIPIRSLYWCKPKGSGAQWNRLLRAKVLNSKGRKFHWTIGETPDESNQESSDNEFSETSIEIPRTPEGKIAKIISLRCDSNLSLDFLHTQYMKHNPPLIQMLRALYEAESMVDKQKRIDLRNDLVKESQKWIEEVPLFPWQRELWNLLSAEPDPRHILWVFDKTGGQGKSTLMRHYYYLNYSHTLVFTNVPKKDLLYQASQKVIRKVVIINLTKNDKPAELEYAGFENLKDNIFTVSKYHGDMVDGRPLTILVLANEEPFYSGMILDRWVIGEITSAHQPISWFKVQQKAIDSSQIEKYPHIMDPVPDTVNSHHVYLNLAEAADGGHPSVSMTASQIAMS